MVKYYVHAVVEKQDKDQLLAHVIEQYVEEMERYIMLGSKQLAKIVCVACTEPFGEHTKRGLIRCIFRIQGTMVSNVVQNEPKDLDDK